MDRNPRVFYMDVVGIDANVDADTKKDYVVIECAGSITPTAKERIDKALKAGEFEIKVKRLA